MADRSKKENTPPPLLLMPAGGGLTLVPPEQPNVLMPVVQTSSPLLTPEEEAEADSFVGQSAPSASVSSIQSNYFQGSSSQTGHDPFSQVGAGPPPTMFAPATMANPGIGGVPNLASGTVPSSLPSSVSLPPGPLPPSGTNSAAGNIYRQKGGRPKYVPPPANFPPQAPMSSSSPFAPPMSHPPTAMVPPMTSAVPSGPSTPFQNVQQPTHGTAGNQFPPSIQPCVPRQFTGGLYFQPVRYHWCFREDQDGLEIWRPFSVLDSMHLEIAFTSKLQESPNNTVVLTNGGRYDVNVGQRSRTPVYWNAEPVGVRRCSWFFKREGDNRYIPYEEELSVRIEEEYKKAMETNEWHRRLEFPGNTTIVMHNANVIVQFPPSAAVDEWGNVQGEMRPRVVKRGVDDFATIEQGEREEVDHLVFFVPGIEDISGGRHRSVESLVNDFRSNSLSLLESHFTQAFRSKAVSRVEFLPVVWSQALEEGVAGLKEQMEGITLPSTAKLRHFVNNSLVDTLFYTSPLYCQKICDAVACEMNRMFHIFLERNQSFSGDVSVAGHSLGAVILFDLLMNQRMPGEPAPADNYEDIKELDLSENGPSGASSEAGEEKEDDLTSLEDLLAKCGLQDKANLFHNEQIDADSLLMCTEQDLKDIGLPMGPRKKLLGCLHEEKMKKDAKSKEVQEKRIIEAIEKKRQASATTTATMSKGSTIAAQYLQGHFGVGQLRLRFHQLDFTPNALYALGSPIAVFMTLRGIQDLGEFFQLPTCPRVYNIFHPFDPMAYRLEPLIRSNTSTVKPVQVPHYKGRKRLHLEFKEAVTRYGTDIKQKIVDSFKSTWAMLNDFAKAHKTDASSSTMENEVKSEMNQMMSHIAQQQAEDDRGSISSVAEEEIHMGQLNEGSRVDYMLQEGPLESFNDYLFALASHSCYWESEDTALLMLREIFMPLGIRPVMPGSEAIPGNNMPNNKSLPPSRESSVPPRQQYGLPPTMSGGTAYQPPSAHAISTNNMFQNVSVPQPPLSSSSMFQPLTSSGFQDSSLVPATQTTGPPPPMFSPSSVPPTNGAYNLPGATRSPYMPPDFSNLPPPSSQMSGPAPPLPPMGAAPVGGYRKTKPF